MLLMIFFWEISFLLQEMMEELSLFVWGLRLNFLECVPCGEVSFEQEMWYVFFSLSTSITWISPHTITCYKYIGPSHIAKSMHSYHWTTMVSSFLPFSNTWDGRSLHPCQYIIWRFYGSPKLLQHGPANVWWRTFSPSRRVELPWEGCSTPACFNWVNKVHTTYIEQSH